MTIVMREARYNDVEEIRDLFAEVYGDGYPHPEFYDTEWLRKAVYDENVLFLVLEMDGRVVMTNSLNMSVGRLDDMIGEAGRAVAAPDERVRGKGLAQQLAQLREEMSRDRVQFLFSEARTPHRGSQRYLENLGWKAAGFQPLNFQFGGQRESTVFYVKPQGLALELRRNNPRVIPEIATLAQTVLASVAFPVDVIVEDEADGYPTGHAFEIEELVEKGLSALLRIERGRVSNREIVGGSFSLSHGFFKIAASDTHYYVARDGDALLGGVGFSWDPIDRKVRVIELIASDDAVKGFLLATMDRTARDRFGAVYLEAEVSAHSPRMQRTLERLGFVAVAYCPSMVFQDVERLDVIRMAKLTCPYELGPMRLLDAAQRMKEIVEHGLEDHIVGLSVTEGARRTDLFRDLPDGELYHLARIAQMAHHEAGEYVIRQGDPASSLYIMLEGRGEVRHDGAKRAIVSPGDVFGEMALVEKTERFADVVLTEPSRIIDIPIGRLERLMDRRPYLGYLVSRNLARALSRKLHERPEAPFTSDPPAQGTTTAP